MKEAIPTKTDFQTEIHSNVALSLKQGFVISKIKKKILSNI